MSAECPAGVEWCAGGQRCAPLLDVHRSDPQVWEAGYGRLVATRVRHGGRDQLELRLAVDLPAGEQRAVELSRWAVVSVDVAVRAAQAGYKRWIRALYRQLARRA